MNSCKILHFYTIVYGTYCRKENENIGLVIRRYIKAYEECKNQLDKDMTIKRCLIEKGLHNENPWDFYIKISDLLEDPQIGTKALNILNINTILNEIDKNQINDLDDKPRDIFFSR